MEFCQATSSAADPSLAPRSHEWNQDSDKSSYPKYAHWRTHFSGPALIYSAQIYQNSFESCFFSPIPQWLPARIAGSKAGAQTSSIPFSGEILLDILLRHCHLATLPHLANYRTGLSLWVCPAFLGACLNNWPISNLRISSASGPLLSPDRPYPWRSCSCFSLSSKQLTMAVEHLMVGRVGQAQAAKTFANFASARSTLVDLPTPLPHFSFQNFDN